MGTCFLSVFAYSQNEKRDKQTNLRLHLEYQVRKVLILLGFWYI